MKTPRFLIGAALLLWGAQTGYIYIAAALALALEVSPVIQLRWSDEGGGERITQYAVYVCDLLLVGVVLYTLPWSDAEAVITAVMTVISLFPMVLFPLIALQAYGREGSVDARALFALSWKSWNKKPGVKGRRIDLSYLFFVLCIVGACAVRPAGFWFYPAVAVLIGWALVANRRGPRSILAWGAIFAIAGVAGYFGQTGLHDLQKVVTDEVVKRFFSDADTTDPLKGRTALGSMAEVKLSNRIVARIDTKRRDNIPFLLHEASYNALIGTTWMAKGVAISPAERLGENGGWKLTGADYDARFDDKASLHSMTISYTLSDGAGVLPMPEGGRSVTGLDAQELKKNTLGAVIAFGTPANISYTVSYQDNPVGIGAPTEDDLKVPKKSEMAVLSVVEKLGLAGDNPEHAAEALKRYFSDNFRYSLVQGGEAEKDPIERFLLDTHSGHCEYFAAATVLLLRAAGVPARYAVGYSVQEYSRLEKALVVRESHAHAWAVYYAGGEWRELDTTPGGWYEEMEKGWKPLSRIRDFFSWGIFAFSQWKPMEKLTGFKYAGWYAALLAAAALAYLAWRFLRRKASKGTAGIASSDVIVRQGLDSEFFALQGRLEATGFKRHENEPLFEWLKRIHADGRIDMAIKDDLHAAAQLHSIYRFDPSGITAEQRAELKRLSARLSDVLDAAIGRGAEEKR